MCGEIAGHHEEPSYSASTQNEEQRLTAFETENCPVTAAEAVVEARQTFFSQDLTAQNIIALPPHEYSFVQASLYPPEKVYNSPPPSLSDPPLFLRHCAFRI